MVFPLTANKKNLPKIPKSSNKKNKKDRDNVDKPASNCEAVYGQQQRTSDILDDTIYRKLSSSRAIFESNKLESACSFLKMLKLKLEQDVGEIVEEADAVVLERTPTNDTISSILDTLIDVSDHITPIVSDVSDASKSMDYSTMSGSSTISEKHFNRTMLATNKLLELSAKTGRNNANLTEGTYYFAHKMVADNLGDMSVFKNSIMSIGDKIYVDRNLLAQLVQLHALLKDTIIKLKTQEEKYLTDLTYRNEEGSSNDGDSASGNATDLSVYDTAIESDPSPAARKLFGKKDKLPKTMIKPRRLSMDNASPVVSKRPSASSQQRNNTTAIVGMPRETANSLTTDKMKKKKLRQSQNAIAEASVLSVDGTVSDNEGPNSTATPSKEDKLCNKNQTPPFLAPDSTYKDGTTNYTSAVSTVGCSCDDLNTKNSNGTMTQDLFSSAVQGTNTSTENSSKLVGTITSILKQTSFYDPELVTSTPMKDNRTQTKRSMDTWASTKGNTSTVSNQTYMTAYNDTIVSSNLIGSRLPGEISNGNPSVNSVRSRSKSASSYRTALNATSPTTVAEYGQDLEKCITELECMSKCLRQAAINKDTLHECFKIFPANQHQLTDTQLPHFHTIVGGVPVVIQITKRPDNLNSPSAKCCRRSCAGSTTADASTCCSDLPQASTKPLTYKLLGSLSKATLDGCLGPRNWGPCNWKKTILRNNKNTEKGDFDKAVRTSILKSKLPRFRLKKRDAAFNTDGMPSLVSSIDMTKSDGVDSHASLPYVPAKSSLPKLDNPEKICSSLQFDVRKVPVTFEDSIMKHPNAKVNDALKDVTVAQLLDSFRPAKCCRKTVLNETPHSTMPYAASLRSLPLQESDLTTIRDIMQKKHNYPGQQ
ncbi:hypothetical protein QE152_g6013 [Popillia japonica]|uniref:Uncharacterized protein n=1 Tax=Popillia japonica TaxID=7064 RepID=A0AAW1MKQ5_POPJA